ncbi:unnamed protein product, partial [Musa banksii]
MEVDGDHASIYLPHRSLLHRHLLLLLLLLPACHHCSPCQCTANLLRFRSIIRKLLPMFTVAMDPPTVSRKVRQKISTRGKQGRPMDGGSHGSTLACRLL